MTVAPLAVAAAAARGIPVSNVPVYGTDAVAQFVYLEYLDGAEAFGHLPSWATASIIPVAFAIMAIRFIVGAALTFAGRRAEPEQTPCC
mgnify:CR=1 FL=1